MRRTRSGSANPQATTKRNGSSSNGAPVAVSSLPKRSDLIGRRKWEDVRDDFHRYYYATAEDPTWGGYPCMKVPGDLLMYQEIICQTRPEVIIETGTAYGGSALFLATVCDMISCGQVITVDLPRQNHLKLPEHPRITYLLGNSVEPRIFREINKLVGNKSTMVILDSDHSYEHVRDELHTYFPFVSQGKYLIVEDTNIGGNPVAPHLGLGPMAAVREFVKNHPYFKVDKSRERFYMTYNPDGYLLRTS